MNLNSIGENEDSFPDPKEEQRMNDKSDFEHQELKESARAIIDSYDTFAHGREVLNREIHRYDEAIEDTLIDFPQHIIDSFKFKIGE